MERGAVFRGVRPFVKAREVRARAGAWLKQAWHGFFFWNRPLRRRPSELVDLPTREAWLASLEEEQRRTRQPINIRK